MSNLVVVQLTDDIQHVQHVQRSASTNNMIQRSFDRYEIESNEEELDYTADNIQRSTDISKSIQRSLDESKLSIQRFDRYEIESNEEELDYTAGNMNQRSAGNMIQRSNISNMIQRSDEIESDEEEYWQVVEQERLKEEYWHLVEQLEEEHGANIPTEDHLLILNTTLSIILEIEQELDLQVDHESFKKMICIIYPEVCQLYCILDSLYQLWNYLYQLGY